ncbi:aminodeoxychorismate synthase component I [Halomonas cerina]|uniref:aminodeoxychorismate synthase n=1 Tax=Halomonas cerina TaxID=447424 RepID=A0A839VDQ8_9GAMM|nr:aminodeoxychorismate synthase component I [Halomonas cerina]MBB3190797.1 para-aminobenzoate synthetase component 1 [Halomonas cerina]
MTARLEITPFPYRPDPLAYFARLRHRPGAVLLDSGRPDTRGGRYDILSSDPLSTLSIDAAGRLQGEMVKSSPFAAQQALLDRLSMEIPESDLPFLGGLIGYWSYDLAQCLEPLSGRSSPPTTLGLSRVGLYDWALIQDHERRESWLVATPARRSRVNDWLALVPGEETCQEEAKDFQLAAPFQPAMSRDTYLARFDAVQRYIQAGDCYQINLAQRFSAPFRGDLWAAYRRLRRATPTPFAGYLAWDEQAILSLSPERFIRCRDGRVETRPIKGTRPRGVTPQEDRHLADELKASPKDRAENVMIVDLLRNDLGRVCRPGSVRVPQLCGLESYANVHHLVSVVTGELAEGRRPLDLLAAAFPGGSITGAPKVRAMQIIDELEPTGRSAYCGSLGYVDVRGHMDTSIAIRTVLADRGRLHLWGGGGLVADSCGEAEYDETLAKIHHLMAALADEA